MRETFRGVRTYSVSTPECVEFAFEAAGHGHRILAWFLDALVISAISLAVALTFMGLNASLTLLMLFILWNAYFMVFEFAWDGRTPGKKWVGIRVLDRRGLPITGLQAVVRNLLRFIDGLPFFYAVGAAVSLLHPTGARLGDLAAGTIVVKDVRAPVPSKFLASGDRFNTYLEDFALGERVRRTLTIAERTLLASLALRRDDVAEGQRAEIFTQAAAYFQERLDLPRPDFLSAERFILNLTAIAFRERERPEVTIQGGLL